MNDDKFEAAIEGFIAALIEVSYGWTSGQWQDIPGWLRRSARYLIQVIGDRDIQFIAGRPMDESVDGVIAVFTPGVLFRADVQPGTRTEFGESFTRISMTPRSDLVRLTTVDDGNLRNHLRNGNLHQGQKITLHYLDGSELVLPLADSTSLHTRKLLAFLPSLVDDLSEASRSAPKKPE